MALTRIETGLIADSAVTTDKIANNAVTQSKIDPTVELGGSNVTSSATAPSSPAAGDLWHDTTNNKLKVYYGSSWITTQESQMGIGSRVVDVFTATAGQTTFTTSAGYTVGYVDVYFNGIKLLPADFTATNATTVVLGSAAELDDEIVVISWTLAPGIASFTSDIFTGNGSQTNFTLSTTPSHENQTTVVIDGVVQIRNTYSVSGSSLVFSEAPGNNTIIEVTTSRSSGVLTTSYNDLTDKPDLTGLGIKISNIQVTDSGGTVLDDTAVDTAGGYIKLTGSGFVSGCQVLINNVPATSVTFVNSTTVRAQVPATAAGTYIVYLVNPDGGVGIRVNGVTFSTTPSWVTGSSLEGIVDTVISIQLSATGASTYSLQAGSTLPTGLTLTSGGLLSGTVTGLNENTIYNFTILAIDTENQDSPRAFSITISVGDQYFNRTVLAITGDVNTFVTDASTNNFALTINGDTKPFDFSPYNTSWSNYFNNNPSGSQILFVPDSDAFNFGSGDFTVEAFIYRTSTRSGGGSGTGSQSGTVYAQCQNVANNGNRSHGMNVNDSAFQFYYSTNGSTDSFISWSYTFNLNQWYHVAISRSGNLIYGFVDGQLVSSQAFTATIFNSSASLAIGGFGRYPIDDGYTLLTFGGYISNLRLIKGTAVYTSAFTSPTTHLTAITNTSLLTCQNNRFIDNSTNNFTITKNGDPQSTAFGPFTETDITTGSGYFDGSGDYLNASYLSSDFGTGNFTLECWVYNTARSDFNVIIDTRSGATANPFVFAIDTSGYLYYYTGTTYATTTVVPLNQWVHCAIARSGTTIKIFQNGVEVLSRTDSSNLTGTSTTTITIGRAVQGTAHFNGYLSNLRIVKGTAVYTSAFTPPTAALTAVTNTSLLTLQTRQPVNNHTFIDESGLNNNVTRNGNPSQGSFSPYSPAGWSNHFDGTGDYLQITPSSALDFGTGDFTVEFWTWFNDISVDRGFIGSSTSGRYDFCWRTSTGLNIGRVNTAFDNTFAWTPTVGVWYHIVYCRSGTSLRVFVNGTQIGSTATNSISYNSGAAFIVGGSTTADRLFLGYLSNMRLIKGTALYTSNFTPPTAPLTAITNTSLLTCQSNRFIDNSTDNFTLTRNGDVKVVNFSPFKPSAAYSPTTHGGSAYFDGSDYLQTNSTDSGLIRTGPFTIELWVYPQSLNTNLLSRFYWQTGDNGGWTLATNSSGFVTFSYSTGAWNSLGGLTATSNPVVINQWNHIAVTRDTSNTLRIFVNGNSAVTPITLAQSLDTVAVQQAGVQPRTFRVGVSGPGDGALSGYYTGYISSVKTQTGVAKYTANFVPALQIFSNESGINYLSNMNTMGIVDVSSRNVFETVGDAKIRTDVKKYGTGSIFFDGTGDYLPSQQSPMLAFGTGDFTIEFWMNSNDVSTAQRGMFQTSDTAGGLKTTYTSGITMYQGAFAVNGTSNGGIIANIIGTQIGANAGGVIATGTWYHIAVVRASGLCKLYVNGTAQPVTATITGDIPGQYLVVGGYYNGSYLYNGYLDDFRITRFARYTANFTPPTTTFLTR